MSTLPVRAMSIFRELKRRNVFKVAAAYIIVAWLIMQAGEVMSPALNLPDWVNSMLAFFLILGFPLAMFFAWAFEMTPEGLRKEKDVDRSQSITHVTGQKLNYTIIALLVATLGYFAWDKFMLQLQDADVSSSVAIEGGDTPEDEFQAIAVLPFVNMSEDAGNEYFSDGLTEELLNILAKIKELRVAGRTSSFAFKGKADDLRVIGKKLNVSTILEGSVRKAGNRVRITAQLINVEDGYHLWAETYDRELDDIFAIQDEIAQAIVSALKVTLTGTDQTPIQTRSTNNVDAYNKYLLGRHLWNQRSPDSLLASAKPLQEAVAMDPGYGQAWAALADAYVLIPEYDAGTFDEYIPLARAAAAKALAIYPESAQALTTSAYIKFMYDYDRTGAHADFEKAIEIDPNYATAHQWHGELLAAEGKLDAALDEVRLARRADPLAPIMPHVMGWILMFTDREEEEAYAYFNEALALDPHFQGTIGNLGTLNLMSGRFDEARTSFNQLATIVDYNPATDLAVIDALENPALKEQALQAIAQDDSMPDGVTQKGFYLMLLGEPALALDSIEKAFAEGDPYAIHMKRMDVYDPIRENPRFVALLKKMNMWP